MPEPNERNVQTQVKTIRLPKSLERSLEAEARSRKISLNSFITSILARYDEWDRLAEKFGFMCMADDALTAILDSLDDAQIAEIARECGASIPKAIMEFWFSHVSYEAFLKYLSLRSTYQHFVNHEVVTDKDGHLMITARHEHGRKWSVWSSNFLAEAIRTNFGVNPQLEINGNTFRIDCPSIIAASTKSWGM